MGKQINRHLKISGTIDDLSFYKSQDGFLVRAKGGVPGDRIKTDPRFRNTRLNGLEFGATGKAAKLLRKAINEEMHKAGDNRASSRVTQRMSRVLKSDPVNDWGERRVSVGNLALLEGLEFNLAVPFDQAVKLKLNNNIDRPTGQAVVNIPAHIPVKGVTAPADTTHCSFFAAAVAIDFDNGVYQVARTGTAYLPWNDEPLAATALQMALPANSNLPILLLIGIEFAIIVNGRVHSQSKGASALQLAMVDMAA